MDVHPEDPLFKRKLRRALDVDDPTEVLYWFAEVSVTCVEQDVTCSSCARRQLTHFLHWAINSAMRQARFACAKVLLDLLFDKTEINTVSKLIWPPPCPLIDEYQPQHSTSPDFRSSHLHVAASLGSDVLVEMLMERGASPLALDSDLNTPLIALARRAPREHCLHVAKILLCGCSRLYLKSYVDMLNSRGLGALHYAVARGLDGVVNFLLSTCSASVDPYRSPVSGEERFVGFSPLHMAIMHNNHWAVGRLLAEGADVNLYIPTFRNPGLMASVPHVHVFGHCDCGCSFQHRFHIVPPQLSGEGMYLSPTLGLAAFLDDDDSVEALVKAGAHLEATDSWGFTPLCLAVFWSNYRSTVVLLSLGARASTMPICGRSLLHVALSQSASDRCSARHRKLESINSVVRELLDSGDVAVNERDACCATPLILACGNGFYRTVPQLIGDGSSLASVDQSGRSALFYATVCSGQERNRLMMRTLLHFGAGCLEPLPYGRDGTVQSFRSPAVAALFLMDTLSLFLLYKWGALRDQQLIRFLKGWCCVSRSSESWPSLFRCSAVFQSPKSPVNVPTSSQRMARLPHDGQETGVHLNEIATYTTADWKEIFDRDQDDWKELLRFCDLPEDHCFLGEHDSCIILDESDPEAVADELKLMQLTYRFLQKVSTTVPSLQDLCRWTVREAVGDEPLAWKRAALTLGLPSLLLPQLMIGLR